MVAWNLLQFSFYTLFCDFMGPEREESSKNIWNSSQSDTGQRIILKCLVEGLNENNLTKETLWAIKQADQLSKFRNSYAHVTMMGDMQDDDIFPLYNNKSSYVQNLEIIENKKLFIPLRNDICKLQDYVLSLSFENFHAISPASLRRPQLQVLKEFGWSG